MKEQSSPDQVPLPAAPRTLSQLQSQLVNKTLSFIFLFQHVPRLLSPPSPSSPFYLSSAGSSLLSYLCVRLSLRPSFSNPKPCSQGLQPSLVRLPPSRSFCNSNLSSYLCRPTFLSAFVVRCDGLFSFPSFVRSLLLFLCKSFSLFSVHMSVSLIYIYL